MELDLDNIHRLIAVKTDTVVRFFGGTSVGDSEDLRRIESLPRRVLNPRDPIAASVWTPHLRRERTTPCDCVARWGYCIDQLRPVQAWALEEAMDVAGLLASIGVGDGKTGIDLLLPMAIPGVRVAVLLIPSSLRSQLLSRDIPQWSAHFKIPNIAGGRDFVIGRPTLHVITYPELSQPKNSDLLRRLGADLITADEAQNLKDPKSARTARFLRHFAARPDTRFAALSGTITTKSIRDYAHLTALALRERSPLPIHPPVVDEWAAALDAPSASNPFPSRPGELVRLMNETERANPDQSAAVRLAFQRRVMGTQGAIATLDSQVGASLVISERKPTATPVEVTSAISHVLDTWERPDGEEFIEALQVATCVRQLSAGFYYRWRFPRGETREQIDLWLARRKAWFSEVRRVLQVRKENLDSISLVEHAATRWRDGYKFRDSSGKVYDFPAHHSKGPLPVYDAAAFAPWCAVESTVNPETETVWISPWLAEDAARWAKDHNGIVWYEFPPFGEAVRREAKRLGLELPLYGGGKDASAEVINERGNRAIIASIKAHGTGKNLQHAFSENLIANSPSDGAIYEQLLGRTHREGQKADTVTAEIYLHTSALRGYFEQARERSRYIESTTGSRQKLCYATMDLDGENEED